MGSTFMESPKGIRILRRKIDRFGRAIRTLGNGFSPYKTSVYQQLKERSVTASADYAANFLNDAMLFDSPQLLWRYAASRTSTNTGLILEFGVYKGKSINFFAKIFADQELFGFDSFEGLAEDWQGYHLPKGSFDLGGELPTVSDNVTLIKGWFDATLPEFLDGHQANVRLCHVDCDTYESALYVLEQIVPRLVTGSILIFDEYYGYPNWQHGEFLAWQQVCKKHKLAYRYIAFASMQVAVVID